MPILSIAIPLEAGEDPTRAIAPLIANQDADIEIVVAIMEGVEVPASLSSTAASDPRVRTVTVAASHRRALWRGALAATTGDWVSMIRPNDAIEPDLHDMLAYLTRNHPKVDALGWNAFQIDPHATPDTAGSVAIPAPYQIDSFDKTAMLKAFFHWEKSLNFPVMPFGIYHAAVRRSLLDAVMSLSTTDEWLTPVPQYEWAAKVVLFAEDLAFCKRPLSAIDAVAYQPVTPSTERIFLFHAGLGLTGAIAEIQFHVLRELGNPWHVNEAFVRACMIDCIMEKDRELFVAKGNAYFEAFERFNDGVFAHLFRPDFRGEQKPEQRRGLHENVLHIDRFVGGAQTAQAFFGVVRAMIAPVGMICGGVTDAA